jgi:hypothetical protein
VWTLVVGAWTRHVEGLWQEVVTVISAWEHFRVWNVTVSQVSLEPDRLEK